MASIFKRLALVSALVFALLLAFTYPASAGSGREIQGVVTCKNAVVSGVWIESPGGRGFANLESVVQGGGLNSATFSFMQSTSTDYYLSVGCGETLNGEWATVLYSDTAYDNGAWACNDIHPAWGIVTSRIKALTLMRAVVHADVEYGRCIQV